MKYGSVCSGIEAATSAWHPLGWEPVFFSEIEPFPSAVLKEHYPSVPNHGDMTKFKEWPNDPIDLLVGGTPCQSFSVAGLRKGLDDPRGNLMLTFCAIAARYHPKWLVWENVPGVLSSNGGRDFASLLRALEELGYGWAYRILDAQYFGVAQRRRRVFVVGCLGDWRGAAAVLFERHSLSGNSVEGRPKRKTAPTIPSRSTAGGGLGTDFDCDGGLVAGLAFAQNTRDEVRYINGDGSIAGALAAEAGMKQQTYIMAHGQANAEICSERSPALTCNHEAPIVVGSLSCNTGPNGHDAGNFACNQAVDAGHVIPVAFKVRCGCEGGGKGYLGSEETAFTLSTLNDQHLAVPSAVAFTQNQCGDVLTGDISPSMGTNCNATGRNTPKVMASMQVRRLTPVECERLQGFPDNHTKIPWRKKGAEDCPDGPRYKALGNSMAVPVMNWIGKRIQMVEEMTE